MIQSHSQIERKILSVHTTKAVDEVLERLSGASNCTPVLHWFSGDERSLTEAVKRGCWFSVNPQMFRSTAGRERIAMMPRHKVLSESDGPFVKVNRRAATPCDVQHVIHGLADIWGEPTELVNQCLDSNLKELVSTLTI
jgi:TatD DNase family protein